MTGAEWLDELESRSWRALLGAHWRLMSRLDAELQQTQQMSVAEYAVLVHLSEAEGEMLRMSDLAEQLLLSPSGLTRRLDGLVSEGFVERLRCPTDRRGSLARLTPAGRRRLERAAKDHVEQVRRHFVDRLSRRQLASLAEALEKIADEGVCGRSEDSPPHSRELQG
ncbi:MAG TPA: MarR family transcriptional regulator [Acidimicrobiales bacterium]|nr:MarR family transcriptional regulator [Acidimicrobiales bacterium]